MPIPQERQARNMDLVKSMRMGIDECHIALKEAYGDLTDEEFWRYALPDRHNIATVVMHVLQQHDEFNGNLQYRRGVKARHEWHFLRHEERFHLWGVAKEKLPKPGDAFPTVAEVARAHDEIHEALIRNMSEMSEEDFTASGVGKWPRLCDMFFRATYHANAHVRQIWFLRGVMGIQRRWPEQHYA